MGRIEDNERWQEKLEFIPLDRIRPPRYLLKKINVLAPGYSYDVENFTSAGVLNSILVSYEGTDEKGLPIYECIDGWERVCIERYLRFSTDIKATIRHNVTNSERKFWSINAQGSQHGTSKADYAQQLKRIIEADPNLSRPEIAKRLGWSVQQVTDRLSLTNLIPEAEEAMDRGRISMWHGIYLGKLSPALQKMLLPKALKLGIKQFREEIVFYRARKTRKTLSQQMEAEFYPIPSVPKRWSQAEAELVNKKQTPQVLDGITSLEEAFQEGIRWVYRMNRAEVKKQKDAWEKKQAKIVEEQERRKRSINMEQ